MHNTATANKNVKQRQPTAINRHSLFLLSIASCSNNVANGIKSPHVTNNHFTVVNFKDVTRLAASVPNKKKQS